MHTFLDVLLVRNCSDIMTYFIRVRYVIDACKTTCKKYIYIYIFHSSSQQSFRSVFM